MNEYRVLVVDDDPWILRMVSSSLSKKGHYSVDTARDGQQALSKIESLRPSLIVTDVMMPVMDGWSLVQRLRAHASYAAIPVLFLTALGKDEQRLRQLGLSPDDYICKPFRFEELERRIAQRIAHSAPAATIPAQVNGPRVSARASARTQTQVVDSPMRPAFSRPRPQAPPPRPPQTDRNGGFDPAANREPTSRSALDGHLEQLGLSSLLVMMEMERKDGVLTLLDGTKRRTGRIFLRAGRVICAKIDTEPALDGKKSVYEMLRWNKGRFSFNAMEVDMEDTVESSTTGLLMEGARLMDESARDE